MKRTMLAAMMLSAAMTPAAFAGDIQGDAYECKDLWSMRNQIYKSNGYCFRTSKAIQAFGNAGCRFDKLSLVPISATDRQVLSDIRKSERRQGC